MNRTSILERQSPWGLIPVADAHVHFFSHQFFAKLAEQKPGLTHELIGRGLEWRMPPAEPEKFADAWAEELNQNGVARAALIASVPGDEASVVAAVRAHPDRFFAFAMANPRAWQAGAFSEVCVACLFPAMSGYSLHDPIVRPILEWAEQGSRAIFVHCGVLSVGVRDKLGLESRFDMRFSNPIDLHAIAMAHPKVSFIVPHFGAGYFREALMLADLCPNVYLDTSSSNRWMRYQESQLDLRQVFRRTLDIVGPKRLLFGTDSASFPAGWNAHIFEDQAKALYEVGIDNPSARAIFGENLLRILGQ